MEKIALEIHDIAFGGAGVGRHEGKTVFVPLTITGEKISAQVVREKKRFAEAEMTELLLASPDRVEPGCPYFGACGGCSYQHMAYDRQLQVKARQVEQTLQRLGRLPEVPMRPMVASPHPYGYRNRITVHSEGGVIGFYRRQEHVLLDIERCPIAQEEVNAKLSALRRERPRPGHYTLRAGGGPRVFEQTNDEVAALLLEQVRSLIPEGQELLVDAYCGAGFFLRGAADRAARGVGIDWDRFAVEAARAGAGPNEEYHAGDVAAELQKILRAAPLPHTTVIVDPPAAGLDPAVRDILRRQTPGTLLYISCNPATLARDLLDLGEHYVARSITPFDMFPQTAEIEVLAELKPAPGLHRG